MSSSVLPVNPQRNLVALTVGVGAAAVLGVAAIAASLWHRNRRHPAIGGGRCSGDGTKKGTPTPTQTAAVVSELWVFPIKGVQGYQVASAVITEAGFEYDRQWAVVYPSCPSYSTDQTVFAVASSNKFSRLASATAMVDRARNVLRVMAPRYTDEVLEVPLMLHATEVDAAQTIPVELFGMRGLVTEADKTGAANRWFASLVGNEHVKLCRIFGHRHPADSESHKGAATSATDAIRLHDYAAFHIICESGMQWLASHVPPVLTSSGTWRLSTAMFRANIVVRGGAPFPDEDTWLTIRIGGDVRLRVGKQSGRCVIPTHDAVTGERHRYFEPTATLRRLRSAYHRHQLERPDKHAMFMFGLDLFHDREDVGRTLRVGDTLTVEERQPPPSYLN